LERESPILRVRLYPPRPLGILAMLVAAVAILLMIVNPHFGTRASTTAPPSRDLPVPAKTPGLGAKRFGPLAVTEDRLHTLTAGLGRLVYWAGPEASRSYELKQVGGGRVTVRYLPPGTSTGDKRLLRTVTTYPVANAFLSIRAIAQEPGAVSRGLPGGGLAAYRASRPHVVFLSFPDDEHQQVEVFDPSTSEAQRLAFSGTVSPVH